MALDKDTVILAIESSCDDTSAAVLRGNEVLSNLIANQKVHEEFGGVVPELASRAHLANIVPVVEQAIKDASISRSDIQAVAFTRGPGLLGSLLVGTSFAKSMSLALDVPLIEVNHMQAHILAHFVRNKEERYPEFPFLCLTVSGGHTQLVLVKDHLDMEVIGETMDDAAGEAFDKIAKVLGLPYPGGPHVDKLAKEGDPNKFKFSVANLNDFRFSFSGLKTSVLYFLRDEVKEDPQFIEKNLNDLCASVQSTIITTLLNNMEKAADHLGVSQVCLAGGVSANSELRRRFMELCENRGWEGFIPEFQYCTDNAGMIGIAGQYLLAQGKTAALNLPATARMKF